MLLHGYRNIFPSPNKNAGLVNVTKTKKHFMHYDANKRLQQLFLKTISDPFIGRFSFFKGMFRNLKG